MGDVNYAYDPWAAFMLVASHATRPQPNRRSPWLIPRGGKCRPAPVVIVDGEGIVSVPSGSVLYAMLQNPAGSGVCLFVTKRLFSTTSADALEYQAYANRFRRTHDIGERAQACA